MTWHSLLNSIFFSFLQDKTLFHPVSGSCIDCNPAEKKIFMNRCDPLSETQQWIFEHTNMTVLEKFNSKASSQKEKRKLTHPITYRLQNTFWSASGSKESGIKFPRSRNSVLRIKKMPQQEPAGCPCGCTASEEFGQEPHRMLLRTSG